GGTDVYLQASMLGLYDPDRSQTVIHEGRIGGWGEFLAAMGNARGQLGPKGAGMRLLTETVTSPTLAAQIQALLKQFPEAKWHQYEPCGRDNEREGTRLAFGKPVNPVYRIERADVILSLDSNFLTAGPGHVRYAREFSRRRTIGEPGSTLNRLYVIESMPTSTGAMADHRLPIRATEVEGFARQLAVAIGGTTGADSSASKAQHEWMNAVARDLQRHRGTSLVIAGEEQTPAVHALAHAINAALGNAGTTVYYTEPLEANPVNEIESLRDFKNDLDAGKVDFLVMLGGNPVYDAPADFDFGPLLLKAKLRVHSGLYYDETAELCHWHVPATHYLEAWGDSRAYDGTIGIVQPLIAPLYEGRSAHEMIAVISGEAGKSGHDIVRDYWKGQRPEKDKAFETFWEQSLHDGVMAKTALPAISVAARSDAAKQTSVASGDVNALEIVFRPGSSIYDGRFSNNGLLQELPKPNARITWDNAAMMSLATAGALS